MTTPALDDAGPDLAEGVTLADFHGRTMLRGHVGEEAVLLARLGDGFRAVGAFCTHYGGPLEQGILVADTVHCPLHHACFSLQTGEALGAPAFDALPCWQVEQEGDRIIVCRKAVAAAAALAAGGKQPADIVIVGGGAAGFACAEMLRRRGYRGRLTMLSADADWPCDRPNLSKDFLAGAAPDAWIPLKPESFYTEQRIDVHLATPVEMIDLAGHRVTTADGRTFAFDRLLIATGAEPVRLPIPGADRAHVFTLRSFADSRAIVARAATARSAVVLGSGFIGLEAAAALRQRGLDVHVVSLDERPLERVLGPALGDHLRRLHEGHGVHFHMQTTIAAIEETAVQLADGTRLVADIVIIGVGVRPRTALAEAAGLRLDHGVLVDQHLETAVPGVYAAGDVARWAATDGATMRVEHWVVAERQGQVVAENMLGGSVRYVDTPFFWSAHFDVAIRYVGHAEGWDSIEVDGDIGANDCAVKYRNGDKIVAVATIGRDRTALEQAQKLAATAA